MNPSSITKQQVILWVVLTVIWILPAISLALLDDVGMYSIDRTESFPNEQIPPDQVTAFDFYGGMASLFITIPLSIIKGEVAIFINHLFGIDIFAIARVSDWAYILFNTAFDILLWLLPCLAFFAVFFVLLCGLQVSRSTHRLWNENSVSRNSGRQIEK